MSTPGDLVAWARSWLAARGWTWTEDVGQVDTILRVESGPAEGPWRWYLQVHTEQRQVALLTVLDDAIEPDRRTAVAEVVLRATYGMNVGAFEIDLDDGELRFRSGVALGATTVDPTQLHALLDEMARTNTSMTEGYLPAVTAVLDGDDPVSAVHAAEN